MHGKIRKASYEYKYKHFGACFAVVLVFLVFLQKKKITV